MTHHPNLLSVTVSIIHSSLNIQKKLDSHVIMVAI